MNINGYTTFGETDTGGGYDWAVFAVWTKNNEYYWASDSGCSCNSPWDNVSLPSDLRGPATTHQVITELCRWGTDNYRDISTLIIKLMDER